MNDAVGVNGKGVKHAQVFILGAPGVLINRLSDLYRAASLSDPIVLRTTTSLLNRSAREHTERTGFNSFFFMTLIFGLGTSKAWQKKATENSIFKIFLVPKGKGQRGTSSTKR